MGWFDIFSSFEDMIDDKLYYIKHKLADWVEMIAFGAIMFYEEATGIGKTIWDDLELWLDQRIDDFLPDILGRITSARNLAQYLHDTLKIELEEKIEAASGLPEQIISLVMSKLEPKIVSARQYAEFLTDTLKIEIDKQIKTTKGYAKSLQTETLATLDRRIDVVTLAIGKMDKVAGAARAKLIQDLEVLVKIVEKDALAARNAIKSNLNSAITALENSSKVARVVLEKSLKNAITALDNSSKAARTTLERTLNNTIDVLEREAKEAREVLEGTLIQIIESVEDALETALTDLERRFKGLLDMVINRVDILEGWVDNFAAIFDKELNKYQNRVITWIVDGFEGILDRVFK